MAGSARLGVLGLVTLTTWVFTACLGAFMLGSWALQGGIARRRTTGAGPPLPVIFGHAGLAVTGLLVWASSLLTGWLALAWAAVGLLMPAVGLGLSTVTLWTPYPGPGPAGVPGAAPSGPIGAPGSIFATRGTDPVPGRVSDDLLKRALTDEVLAAQLAEMALAGLRDGAVEPPPRPRWHLTALIPAAHGAAAIATLFFSVLAAASAT